MKAIDFSQTGGFPLTQNELDFLQQAYTESLNALSAMGDNGTTPTIISGMGISIPSPGTTATSDGWFFYGGEMIRFIGATVTPTGSDVPLVQITPSAGGLVYNDGATHNVVLEKTATLIAAPSVTDALNFPLSDAKPYQVVFGENGRETNWNSISVLTPTLQGNVSGTFYYKKNWLTNTLHIRAMLTANVAQNFNASPGALNSLMCTLPSGYIPNNSTFFTSYYFAPNLFKDDLGVSWVKHLTSVISSTGQVQINFIRPDAAITAYTVIFNTIIPLD